MIDLSAHLHAAVVGQTMSGKTHLCRRGLLPEFRKAGIGCIVLHKEREPWTGANWQTDDPEKFLAKFWKCWGCAVFIEMADGNVKKFDDRFHKCFTAGRHQGHRCFYLAQRGEMVHPTIRENCDGLYLFSCGNEAAKTWAREFSDEELFSAAKMPPRQFLYKKNRYTDARLLALGK